MKYFLVLLILAITAERISSAGNYVVCYYGSWAHYRPGNGKVSVSDLNPHLCTHMIYTFLGVTSSGGVQILDSWLDIDLGGFRNMVALKNQNRNLKVLAAIGGWNQGGAVFSQVVENPSTRTAFVNNIANFVRQYGFDGFDLDWEYPGANGGRPQDKANFIQLLRQLRPVFNQNRWLLTAAVGATRKHRDASYDVAGMNSYLDLINIMSYDLYGSWDPVTGHNAPMSGSANSDHNIESIIPQWINAGASPSKLTLGLGFYGRSFTLANPNNNGLGAPAVGGGTAGPFTREAGTLSYLEVCDNLRNGWTQVWSDAQKVPYAFRGNQWVGYDNIRSLDIKVDFAKRMNLAGVMVWSIEQDDIRNVCGGGDWVLLRAINKRLGSPSTGGNNGGGNNGGGNNGGGNNGGGSNGGGNNGGGNNGGGQATCTRDGIMANPADCASFIMCSGGVAHKMACGAGTLFDKSISNCNHAALVKC